MKAGSSLENHHSSTSDT